MVETQVDGALSAPRLCWAQSPFSFQLLPRSSAVTPPHPQNNCFLCHTHLPRTGTLQGRRPRPRGSGECGAAQPQGPRGLPAQTDPLMTPTHASCPSQQGQPQGLRKAVGKGLCRPLCSPAQGVLWGSVGHPRARDWALEGAQDDSMGKKCPQEEYHASPAKTTPAYQSLPPNLPAGQQGGSGLSGPSPQAPPRGQDPGPTDAAFPLSL